MNRKIKVLLVDDHPTFRRGLRSIILECPDIEVIEEAETGEVAIQLLDKINPEVIVMDINMPDLDGIKATRQILSIRPKVKILALSMYSEEYHVHAMLKAGAMGYLLKNSVADELLTAIRKISRDEMVLSSAITRLALNLNPDFQSDSGNTYNQDALSLREQEILQLVARGLRNKEIAEKVYVSPETVKKHLSNMFKKLKVDNRINLVAMAKKLRML